MNQPAAHIVVLGGDPALGPALSAALEPEVMLRFARAAGEAIKFLSEEPADIVVLDLVSAKTEGFEFLRLTRENPPLPTPWIHALAAANDMQGKLRAYELGALDCASQPLEPELLRARLHAWLQTKRKFEDMLRGQRELTNARLAAESNARAKSEFLSAMSHEIRTPMNGVIAMVGLLMETSLTPEQRGYLETIHTSGESLLGIINDILDFSKIEAGKMELDSRPFELRTRIEETLDLLATKAAEKDLDLVYQADAAIPQTIEGDSLRLRQVLVNLLSNAVKFTEKGDILVQVKLLSAQPADMPNQVRLNLHFSVRDSGVGIKPERLAHLFKPFVQAEASTARRYGGTGLGLAISKRLVEIMGGKMWADSTPGEGSTFHFTLQAHAEAQAAPPALAARQPKLANLRTLIVEDNATVRRALAEQAAQWGMTPRTAENAAQALGFLQADESFDLAVVDTQLPGVDGAALVAEIRQQPRTVMLPLVLLTPLGVRADAPETRAPNVNATSKPLKPSQFYAAIERALFSPKKAEISPPAPKTDQPLAERVPWRILLCDDNAINQKVAARIVQQLGYKPDLAVNGREALAALDKQHYDLVFMDVMMPEMDGYEATRAIREREKNSAAHPNYTPHVLIIAMTAHAMQSDREKCINAGMDDYLAKPIRPNDVRGILEKWAAQAAAAAPAASQPVAGVPAPASPVAAPAVSVATAGPPVEMTRLMDLNEGNGDNVRELLDMFYAQTNQQLQQVEDAVRAGNTSEVARVAHSCKGACATLGMTRLAAVLLQLEKLGKSGPLTDAEPLCAAARAEVKEIQNYLSGHPAVSGTAPAPRPAAEEPPLDMSRLMDLTGGNADNMHELIEMFYAQTERQLTQIEDAIHAGKAAEVGQLAHSCKGASATLGMARFASVLLQLEKLGKSGRLDGGEQLCATARNQYRIILNFLSAHPAVAGTPLAAMKS